MVFINLNSADKPHKEYLKTVLSALFALGYRIYSQKTKTPNINKTVEQYKGARYLQVDISNKDIVPMPIIPNSIRTISFKDFLEATVTK